MVKIFLLLGSFNAFMCVAIGAFGAHALRERLSVRMLEVYETAVQYHMFHALGLIVVAWTADKLGGSMLLLWSGWFMFIGIVLFSGSLYSLSISGITKLGIITPFGGVAFLAGWLLLFAAVWRHY